MAETLSLTGANGVSEIHIETGLLDHAGTVILEILFAQPRAYRIGFNGSAAVSREAGKADSPCR